MTQQDKQLDRVGDTMTVLHQMGTDIGVELEEQNKWATIIIVIVIVIVVVVRLIDELDEDVQRTDTRLSSLTKRVNKAIKNSSGQYVILLLLL